MPSVIILMRMEPKEASGIEIARLPATSLESRINTNADDGIVFHFGRRLLFASPSRRGAPGNSNIVRSNSGNRGLRRVYEFRVFSVETAKMAGVFNNSIIFNDILTSRL